MSCTQVLATVSDYINIWRLSISGDDEDAVTEIQLAIDMASGNAHMALVAADACECTLPVYTLAYLKKIVVIEAAALFAQNCGPALSDALRETYITWVNDQLAKIEEGKVDPCGGTGSSAPAVGWAEQLMPGINDEQILTNSTLRNQ